MSLEERVVKIEGILKEMRAEIRRELNHLHNDFGMFLGLILASLVILRAVIIVAALI